MSYNQVTTANQSFLELGLAVLLRRTSLSEQIDVSHYLTSCIDGILSSKTTERHQYYQLLSFYLQQCQAIEYPKLLQSIERGNILIETARPSDYSTLPVFLHYLASVNDKHPELKANWTKNMSKIVQTCLRVYSKNKDSCEVTGFVLDILQALLTSDNDTLVLPHTNQLQEICLQIIFPSSSSAVGTVRSQRCVDLSVSVYTLLLSHCNLERYAEALKNLIGIYYGVLVQLDYPKMSINKKITSSMWVGGLSGRKGSEGQGMQKAKHYREIFLRATKVLVMVLETGHCSHRPSFPLDLYLPLLPALLSYKESTVNLQDRMSYMENDEGISRVDAMFVFSDLQADILQVLHAILSLSTVPSSMPLLQSAPHLLPHLFTYLYAHCTFHSETRCLTSFSANLSTLCNVLSALGHWIRIFPTSVVKMLTEYEKIHAHRHVCVELWIYVNSSLVLTQDPTSTLLASSQASKTGTSAISPLDAELMFDAVHSVMVTYLTSLAPYMSTSVRQQISSQMFIVLQYVSNLLHASAVNDSVRMHRQRVFTDYVPRILELAYLDLTLYPQPCVPTSNLLLLQEIVGRLKCSSLGMGRGAAVWGCIEVGIAGLLFPSQVVLPGAGKVEDIVAKLIQQQQEEAGAAQVEGKRGHSGSVMEAEEQEKKKVRLEDLVSFSSSPSAPLPPALPSSPAERDEKEKAQVANKPSLSEPSMQTTKAAASSSIKPPVQEEDDDDDDLPDINLDDD